MIAIKLSEDGTSLVVAIFAPDGTGLESKLDVHGASAMVAKVAMLLPYLVQQAITKDQPGPPVHKFDVKLSS